MTSTKSFLIIGLLAITNLLTVLALTATQKEYASVQTRASEETSVEQFVNNTNEELTSIDSNDFAVDGKDEEDMDEATGMTASDISDDPDAAGVSTSVTDLREDAFNVDSDL